MDTLLEAPARQHGCGEGFPVLPARDHLRVGCPGRGGAHQLPPRRPACPRHDRTRGGRIRLDRRAAPPPGAGGTRARHVGCRVARSRDHEVVAALQVYRAHDCDVIIGMGGRAAMDTAKAVAVLSSNGGSVADYDGFDRVTQPTPPTVMIPTTIGSGAEILQSCAINDTSQRRMVTMLGCALVPDACLVDPRLTSTLSPGLVAASGSRRSPWRSRATCPGRRPR